MLLNNCQTKKHESNTNRGRRLKHEPTARFRIIGIRSQQERMLHGGRQLAAGDERRFAVCVGVAPKTKGQLHDGRDLTVALRAVTTSQRKGWGSSHTHTRELKSSKDVVQLQFGADFHQKAENVDRPAEGELACDSGKSMTHFVSLFHSGAFSECARLMHTQHAEFQT